MVVFGILLYYMVVLGWCLNYVLYSMDLGWGGNTEGFFNNCFLHITAGPFDFGSLCRSSLAATAAVWGLVWMISVRGVRRGLELANKICIPLLAAIMVAMFIWISLLDGAGAGMLSLLTPDLSKLSEPVVWAEAFSQVFFSLSVAVGIMVAYASYLPKGSKIVQNSWITAIADSGFAIFAGLFVFATLGTMAHASGVDIDEVVKAGPGLAFIVYPKAINMMPFGTKIFGLLFFVSLFLAGITSAISILEAFVSAAIDKFSTSRTRVVTVLCALGFLGSLVFTTGAGLYWLDIVDYFVTNFGILFAGLAEALVLGWVLGASKISDYVSGKIGGRPRIWALSLKYVAPVILLILLAGALFDNLDNPYGGYPGKAVMIIGVGWLFILIVASIILARRKWGKGLVSEI